MLPKKEVMIETENFISMMHKRRCLWDVADPTYGKHEYQRVAWMELADVTQAPVEELRKRWRNLRDRFARELRRLEDDGVHSEKELTKLSRLPYFPRLLFLRKVVHFARNFKKKKLDEAAAASERSLSPEPDQERECKRDPLAVPRRIKRNKSKRQPSQHDGELDASQHEVESPERELESPERASSAEVGVAMSSRESPAAEARKELRSPSPSSDSDTQFLLSLAPFVRCVPRRRKLLVRARLMQVLIDEQNHTHN